MTAKAAHLEDFGARGVVSPAERFKEYQTQAKGLPKTKKALFWLGVLEHDHEVAKLVKNEVKHDRRN